jgi:hypothetical protein
LQCGVSVHWQVLESALQTIYSRKSNGKLWQGWTQNNQVKQCSVHSSSVSLLLVAMQLV